MRKSYVFIVGFLIIFTLPLLFSVSKQPSQLTPIPSSWINDRSYQGTKPFTITEFTESTIALVNVTNRFNVTFPDATFSLSDLLVNFTNVRGERGMDVIEDADQSGDGSLTLQWGGTYNQYAMEFNVSKITTIYGFRIRIWVQRVETLSVVRVELCNSSGGFPSTALTGEDLYSDQFGGGSHYPQWQNLSVPITLYPQYNPYFLVIRDNGVTASDFLYWRYVLDSTDGNQGGAYRYNTSWYLVSPSIDLTLEVDEKPISTYSVSEVNLQTTFDEIIKPVTFVNTNLGTINYTKMEVDDLQGNVTLLIGSEQPISCDVSYNSKFSKNSIVDGGFMVMNGSEVNWEMNFTRQKVGENYSITIPRPASWTNIKVVRNSTDVTASCVFTSDSIIIPNATALDGWNAWSITAESPNLMNGVSTTQGTYERSETFSATVSTLGTGTCNFSIYNPSGTLVKSEIRPIAGGQATFTYTFALTDALGEWNVTVSASNATDAGFIHTNFNLKFISRTLGITTEDSRGMLLQTTVKLYKNDSTLMGVADTDGNGYKLFSGLQVGTYYAEVYRWNTSTLIGNETIILTGDGSVRITTNHTIWFNFTLSLNIRDKLGEPLAVRIHVQNITQSIIVNETVNGFVNYDLIEGNYSVLCWVDVTLVANVSVNLNGHNVTTIYTDYVKSKDLVLQLFDQEGDEPLVPRIEVRNGTGTVVINGTYSSNPSFTLPKGNYSLTFFYVGRQVGTGAIELLTNTFQTYHLNYSTPHTLAIHTIDARYGEGIQTWINLTNSTGQNLYEGYTDSVGQYQASLPADNYTVLCYYPTVADLVANITFNLLQNNFTTIVCDYNITKYYTLSLSFYDSLGELLALNLTIHNSTDAVIDEFVNGFGSYSLPSDNYTIECRVASSLINVTGINLITHKSLAIYGNYIIEKVLNIQTIDFEGDEPLPCHVIFRNGTGSTVIDADFPAGFAVTLPKGNYTIEFYYGGSPVGNDSITLLTDIFRTYVLNYSIPHNYTLTLAIYDTFTEPLSVNMTLANSTGVVQVTPINGFESFLLPAENYTITLHVGSAVVNITSIPLVEHTALTIHTNYTKSKLVSVQMYDREGDEPLSCRVVIRNATQLPLINTTFPSIFGVTLPKGNYTFEFYYNLKLVGNETVELLVDEFLTYQLNYSTPHLLRIRTLDRYHGDPLQCNVTLLNSTGIVTTNATVSVAGYYEWILPADNYTLLCYYNNLLVGNITFNLLFANITDIVCQYDIIYTYDLTVRVTDSDGGDFLVANVTVSNGSTMVDHGLTDGYGVGTFNLQEGLYTVVVLYQGNPVAQFPVDLTGNNNTLVYGNITVPHYYFLVFQCLDAEGNDVVHPDITVSNATAVLGNKTSDAFGRVSFTLLEGTYSTTFFIGGNLVGNISSTIQGSSVEKTVLLNYSIPKLVAIHTVDKDQENVQSQILVYDTGMGLVANVTTDTNGYYDLYLPDGNYTIAVYYNGQLEYSGVLNVTTQTTLPVQLINVNANPDGNGIDPRILIVVTGIIVVLGAMSVYLGIVRPRKVRERARILSVKKHYTEVWSIQHVLAIFRKAGTCISHITYGEQLDRDLLGGFLNAIQSFGMEVSKDKAKGLRTLAYHGMYIVVSKGGKELDFALVMEEEPSADLLERLDALVTGFEIAHTDDFPFMGNITPFQDLEQYLIDYLEIDLKYHHRIDRNQFTKAPPLSCRKTVHRMFKLESDIPLRSVVKQVLIEDTGTDPKVYDDVDVFRQRKVLYAKKKERGSETTSDPLWKTLAKKKGGVYE